MEVILIKDVPKLGKAGEAEKYFFNGIIENIRQRIGEL